MVKEIDLLAIGHSAHDYIIRVPNFPKANFSSPITDMKTFNGGAAANVACVGANLGLKTGLVSAVGGDFKKSEYFEHMENLDINTESLIIVPGEKTPTAFVLTDDNSDQISYFYWGAAKEFSESKVPSNIIKNAEAGINTPSKTTLILSLFVIFNFSPAIWHYFYIYKRSIFNHLFWIF